jgi:hypothetical protein
MFKYGEMAEFPDLSNYLVLEGCRKGISEFVEDF